jgi:hypothetical protein
MGTTAMDGRCARVRWYPSSDFRRSSVTDRLPDAWHASDDASTVIAAREKSKSSARAYVLATESTRCASDYVAVAGRRAPVVARARGDAHERVSRSRTRWGDGDSTFACAWEMRTHTSWCDVTWCAFCAVEARVSSSTRLDDDRAIAMDDYEYREIQTD